MQATPPRVKNLILDAGPLLCLTPLRGLAERYLTVPQVLDELKDKRAREHFERLALTAGVQVEVRKPDAVALAKVMVFAKKTGDYSVLSHADLCVLALTYAVDEEAKALERTRSTAETSAVSDLPQLSNEVATESSFDRGGRHYTAEDDTDILEPTAAHVTESSSVDKAKAPQQTEGTEEIKAESELIQPAKKDVVESARNSVDHDEDPAEQVKSPFDAEASSQTVHTTTTPNANPQTHTPSAPESLSSGSDSEPTLFEDPSDEEDGEGEWITPSNVALHKSRALDLLPAEDTPSKTRRGKGRSKGKAKAPETLPAGCMTADFAMQNVLLQMGLNLVSVEGRRIDRVKTWVLRCHACFKICKDSTKKFCPSCGNPTLLRTSVTASSPDALNSEPTLQVHLKKNFQWKNRGTIYSIPSPKPGTSKTGAGEGLVLREDQAEWRRAEKRADGRRAKDEKKMMSALSSGGGVKLDWMDPDWMPEMLTVGAGGKGRSAKGDMPVVGYGRKNPNERRRAK